MIDERKRKLIERNKSAWMRKRVSESKLGKKRPKSVGIAVSLAQKGIPETAESNEKRRQWNLKHGKKPPTPPRGKESPLWKGGIKIDKKGYILIYKPEHPMARKDGYMFQHRFVMAEKLGRNLKTSELVHHINFNKIDNRPENLEIHSSNGSHFKVHPNHR